MIRLTREVRFSADRDWAGHVEFSRPVTNSWAGWPSAVGLVPYLRLRATLVGEPDPVTGYLCNIAAVDRLLRTHAIPYACEKLAEFGWRQSAEGLLCDLWAQVGGRTLENGQIAALELLATPHLRYAIEEENPMVVALTQQFEFSAAHRLHVAALSVERNRELFGKCNNANGHGHNYIVEVTVAATPDATTGAVTPLPRFEALVKEHIVDVFDHKHLNADTAQFRALNPTVENITRVIFEMLAPQVAPAKLRRVRVYETPKTWAEYAAE